MNDKIIRVIQPIIALLCVVSFERFAVASDWENVHFANYVEIEDLPRLKKLGVNVVLMEFEKGKKNWRRNYEAIAEHDLKVVPVLWGDEQSVWKWNKSESEWELDPAKYGKNTGAKFIRFLQENEAFRKHTFAIYSFHEPWYMSDNGRREGCVEPKKQRKFWRQIRQLFGGELKVYGEEVSWVPECKNGCVDYDYVTLYSFAESKNGQRIYRPGGRRLVGKLGVDGGHGPPTNDRAAAKRLERQQIQLMYEAIQAAPAAPDQTRTKLIALMGTFAHDEEPELWNRMPSANEMREWVQDIVAPEKQRLAGLGWYCFRNPTSYYKQYLHNEPIDEDGQDRSQALADAIERVSKDEP